MFFKIYFSLLFIRVVYAHVDCDLIKDFARTKLIQKGALYTCLTKKEMIYLSKCLMKDSLLFLMYDLNNPINIMDGLEKKYNYWGIIVDADCKNFELIINENIDKQYFYETYHWLISSKTLDITQKLKLLKTNINADINLIVPKPPEDNYTIYDIYNPASEHGGEMKIKNIGFYHKEIGYVVDNVENKYWRRKNMTGTSFKSGVVIPRELTVPLEDYLNSDENRKIDSMHRFQHTALRNCRDIFNFSFTLHKTHSWGFVQADGKFDGLVSLLENKLVDFGSTPLLLYLDRIPFVDYSFGNWILRSAFIYRKPRVVKSSYEIFLRPLEDDVWYVIVATLCVILVILKIIFWYETQIMKEVFVKNDLNVDKSWSFLVLFTLGAFCQQGATCHPKFISSRILAMFVFLFAILIYQFYSASIVSYLLLKPPRTIFNVKDLEESSLQLGAEDILIDRNFFTKLNGKSLYETRIKGKNNHSGFYSPKEGIELVKQGGFAYHVQVSSGYPIIEETFSNKAICELEEVQIYGTQPMYANTQKRSPFKEIINYCMYQQAENGNLDRLRKHWNARRPVCMETAKNYEFNVSFKEFICGPIALFVGCILSIIFLFIEFLLHYKTRFVAQLKTHNNSHKKEPLYPFVN